MADQGRMVKDWFKKAAQDLKTAKLLLAQNNEDFWGANAFHSQQAAEKSIKGFLAKNKLRFTKTHNMEVLVSLVAKTDQKLGEYLEPIKILTIYAVAYRYPEESELPEPLTQATCQKITDLADEVFNKLAILCGIL